MYSEPCHVLYEGSDPVLSLGMGAIGSATTTDRAEDSPVSRKAVRELSHDLRHPCATIRALAAAIQIEADLPEQAANRLRQIVAEARRVEELCTQVLASARAQTALVRLDRVIRDIAATDARLTAVTVPIIARIDELDLRRMLWNLIDNAVRAAGPEGEILVSAWTTDDEVILAVSDNGPGFGGAAPGAAGLGLDIVSSLAEKAGGRVKICVGDPGGAEVRIILPHAREAQ